MSSLIVLALEIIIIIITALRVESNILEFHADIIIMQGFIAVVMVFLIYIIISRKWK